MTEEPAETPPAETQAEAPPAPEPVVTPVVFETVAPLPPPTRGHRLKTGLSAHLALLGADRRTLFATLSAAVVLTVSRYHLSTAEYHRLAVGEWAQHGGLFGHLAFKLHLARASSLLEAATGPVADYLYWFLGAMTLFFAAPLLVGRALGLRPGELGAAFGDWRYGLRTTLVLYLVMLPFVVLASSMPAFTGHYPMSGGAVTSWRSLLTYELGYMSYFVGWEFVYRGLLCVALYSRVGPAAILLHTTPFAVMHAGKPELEAYGSVIAGLALGVVAVRARSFWYGALLHGAVALTMDLLAIGRTARWPEAW